MELLYLISPQYLKSVTETCKDYSFYVAGYRNIKDAINQLYTYNEHNILGYAYVGDYLPSPKLMHELIHKIDIMHTRRTQLILAVKDSESLKRFTDTYQGSKTEIKVLSKFEILNDKIIKRDIVGSLLLSRHSPYEEDLAEEIEEFELPSINYKQPMQENILNLFQPIIYYNNKNETLLNDRVLKFLTNRHSFMYVFRKAMICAHYGEMVDIEPYKDDVGFMIYECVRLQIKEEYKNGKTKITR